MMTMIEVLNNEIQEMQYLRQCEERRDNKAAQDAVDNKFKALTTESHKLIESLIWAKENLTFSLSDSLLQSLKKLLMDEKESIRTGFAEKEAVSNAEKELFNIQLSVKKEWQKRYFELTDSIINTLNAIVRVDSERVSNCMEEIKKGEIWTSDISKLSCMKKSISDAASLIAGLELDQSIIYFLQKMNAGNATLSDLDANVSLWLQKESLERRVRLSFTDTPPISKN